MAVTFQRVAIAGLAGLALAASHVRASGPPASGALARVAQGSSALPPTARARAGPDLRGSSTGQPGRTVAKAASATAVQVYRTACLECHDSDGRGQAGRDLFPKIPDFTERGWQASRGDAELVRSILEGKGKSMPRMGRKLGSVDVRQMVALVRAFQEGRQVVEDEPGVTLAPEAAGQSAVAESPPPRRPVEAARPGPRELGIREGSRLFRRFCVMCHGDDGRGSGMRESIPALPDFTRRAWQEGRSDPQLVVSVLDGKGTGMPPFRNKVGREQVRDLLAYIRAFAPSRTQPAETGPDDFEARFQQLAEEVEDLGRQIRALSSPRRDHAEPSAGMSRPP